jgi:hypothetical protein
MKLRLRQLKNGVVTSDPRLDRVPQFDPRSRKFAVRDVVAASAPVRGRTWVMNSRLDQLQEGACTGFSRAHDLISIPAPAKGIDNQVAREIFHRARRLDEWPGEDYDGSSVLGAVKAAVEMGYIGEYRWAFGIDDVVLALSNVGPVVFGTDWLEGMFNTRPSGLIEVSGNYAGGHAYFIRGVILSRDQKRRLLGRNEVLRDVPLLRGVNSWGYRWGVGGEFYMWADDAERLLQGVNYAGEACVTTKPYKKES